MSFTTEISLETEPDIDAGNQNFDRWLQTSSGKYYWERETCAIDEHLKYLPGPHVLSLGSNLTSQATAKLAEKSDFPYIYSVVGKTLGMNTGSLNAKGGAHGLSKPAPNNNRVCSASPESLPFETDSMSSILATHSLETCAHPDQVLREIKRVLQPEGYALFTGFNPISPTYWGVGNWALRGTKYPKTIWHPRLADWLRLLEFEVVASSMFAYAPTSLASRFPRASKSFENAGDRWWPLLGSAYILVARNTVLGRKLVGGRLTSLLAQGKAVLGPSPASSQRQISESSKDCGR